MLKSARGMAPWSKHANKAHTDFLRIPGNRDTLHRLWKQYKNGAEEAGTAYRKRHPPESGPRAHGTETPVKQPLPWKKPFPEGRK